jgi:serine/threonine protein kinase
MAYLHSQHVLHRDLKPQNILINQAMRPRICDFGLSIVCDLTATQTAGVGTALYMAPEMHTSDHYGPSVDVFAWSCTVYELITGKRVLKGNNLFQVGNAALKGEERPLIPTEWTPEFARLIERAWAVEPNERPSFPEILNVFKACGYQLWPRIHTRAIRQFVRDVRRQAVSRQSQ